MKLDLLREEGREREGRGEMGRGRDEERGRMETGRERFAQVAQEKLGFFQRQKVPHHTSSMKVGHYYTSNIKVGNFTSQERRCW